MALVHPLPERLAAHAAQLSHSDRQRAGAKPAKSQPLMRPVGGPSHEPTPPPSPVIAWLTGCSAAALTAYWAVGIGSLVCGETEVLSFLAIMLRALPGALGYAALVAFLTLVPMPLLVLTERAAHWRRGASDFITGAIMGALMAQIFGVPALDGPRGLALTGLAALSGGIGGLAYWIAAGRPRAEDRDRQVTDRTRPTQ